MGLVGRLVTLDGRPRHSMAKMLASASHSLRSRRGLRSERKLGGGTITTFPGCGLARPTSPAFVPMEGGEGRKQLLGSFACQHPPCHEALP